MVEALGKCPVCPPLNPALAISRIYAMHKLRPMRKCDLLTEMWRFNCVWSAQTERVARMGAPIAVTARVVP